MNNTFTIIYISPYSIDNFTSNSTAEELESILDFLKNIILSHNSFTNITIECVNDIYDYQINGYSFQDKLLDAFNFDEGIYQYYLSELQKIVGEYIKYNNTLSAKSIIISQNNTLPILLPLTYNESILWGDLLEFPHTYDIEITLALNSKYIVTNFVNESRFIELCKLNYIFLDFHDDVEDTLKTIKFGKYLDYIELITHSLNVLHQSYLLISNDANKNLEDLDFIMTLSHKLGKRLECTRQGRNKVEWEFKKPSLISLTDKEIINCEYHLKIDQMDNGRPIPFGPGNPVRIYFGLKSYNELDRKQFKVAHIGMHL